MITIEWERKEMKDEGIKIMNLPSDTKLNGELVFQDIKEQLFENLDTQKITIKNSLIKNCNFSNVNLGHCDLISSKIYKTNFQNISFDCADLFSLWFSGCKFNNVDFSGAGIEDITFIDCQFNNCILDDIGLKRCTFTNASFIEIHPKSSGFILNHFKECSFKSCSFAGSFQYQIFDNCIYESVEMDYSLLKYNFGIGINSGITYIKDRIKIKDVTELYGFLIKECVDQKLFLNATFVHYNLKTFINPILILKSLDAIEEMLSYEILIRNEEIIFLKQVYQYIYERNLFPPILLYFLLNKIKEITSAQKSNIAYKKLYDEILLLYSDIYLKFCSFCDNLQEVIQNLPHYKGTAKLYIHYEQEPSIPLCDILNQCSSNTFTRIKSGYGSFHEIIEMLPEGLEILNTFIGILGISVPIVYSEIQKKKEKKETNLKKIVNVDIINQTSSNNSAKAIQQICKNIADAGLLNADMQGYNNTNIKEIEIQYNLNIHV